MAPISMKIKSSEALQANSFGVIINEVKGVIGALEAPKIYVGKAIPSTCFYVFLLRNAAVVS